MARTKDAANAVDPATGRPLPQGVSCRGPHQYRARKLADGARVTRTFETARLAREWLEETSAAVRAGDFVDRRELVQSTLKELVQRYVASEMQDGGRRRGAAEDRGHVPAITEDDISSLPLSKLTPAAVRGFCDRQAACFAAGTVVKRLNLLAAILSHARSEWDFPLRENPASADAVKRPAGADRKRNRRLMPPMAVAIREALAQGEEPPKPEEVRLLEAVAKSEWKADLPLVRWSIEQAMRQGESMELRWRDVDLDAKVVVVRGRHGRGTKADEHREERGHERRPLVPRAIAVLRDLLPKEGEPDPDTLVFPVGPAHPFRVRFGRMAARAGLEDFTFHDLRHEATSRLAKLYPNPMDLRRVTGHADLKSLDRYYQPDLTELAERAA